MRFSKSATVAAMVAVTALIILLNRNDEKNPPLGESAHVNAQELTPVVYDNEQAKESSMTHSSESADKKRPDGVSVIQDEPVWKNFEEYHFGKEGTAYATYDEAVIRALAFQGDIEALHMLAQHYAKDGDFTSAKVLYFDAAARGSNSAFRELVIIYAADYERSRHQDNSDDALIAMMIVDELLVLVGDKETEMNSNIFRTFNDIKLTQEQKTRIREGARNLYNELNDYRISIGFDEIPAISSEVISTEVQHTPSIPDAEILEESLRDIERR